MDPAANAKALVRIRAMELHADLNQRAVLDTSTLAWQSSPMAGVERRILNRRGGEEILVLEGTFPDEHGHYLAGTYLRNPVGSAHPGNQAHNPDSQGARGIAATDC